MSRRPSPPSRHSPSFFAAADALSNEPGRRAVFVISDGRSTGNHHSLAEAVEEARSRHVTVSCVGYSTAEATVDQDVVDRRPDKSGDFLERLATPTGGVFVLIVPKPPGIGVDRVDSVSAELPWQLTKLLQRLRG